MRSFTESRISHLRIDDQLFGAKAVPIRLREEMDFRLDVDELAGLINDRTKLLILNSP